MFSFCVPQSFMFKMFHLCFCKSASVNALPLPTGSNPDQMGFDGEEADPSKNELTHTKAVGHCWLN